jgi:DNA transformation protein
LLVLSPSKCRRTIWRRFMSEPKGEKLFVNLSASQTRRRLKAFGHGVREVQSAGRNQAVIIHTATGQHARELERKFADVGFSSHQGQQEEPFEKGNCEAS